MGIDIADCAVTSSSDVGLVMEVIRAMGRGVPVAELASETLLTDRELWSTLLLARNMGWLTWDEGRLSLTGPGKAQLQTTGIPSDEWATSRPATPKFAPVALCADDCVVAPMTEPVEEQVAASELIETTPETTFDLLDTDTPEPISGSMRQLPTTNLTDPLQSLRGDVLEDEISVEPLQDMEEVEELDELDDMVEVEPGETIDNLPLMSPVRFLVYNDMTQPGDTLLVVGDTELLGNWDPACGLELEAPRWPLWRADAMMPECTTFECKIVIRRADGTIEWTEGNNHMIEVPRTSVEVPVEVECGDTEPGDAVVLVGSCANLGGWDAAEGLELVAENWPKWHGTAELPSGKTVQFKPLVRHPNGTTSWLDGPLYTVTVPPAPPLVVSL